MKTIILLVSLLSFSAYCQTASVILTDTETDALLSDSIKKRLNLTYPIWRTYKCTEKSTVSYVVLSESQDSLEANGNFFNKNIKAVKLKSTSTGLVSEWEINDLTQKIVNETSIESSIWFWSKYCLFNDLDKDLAIDPIIVYGTQGTNGFDDGRIKIVIVYKGKKTVIRHQNGVLDGDRNTLIDKSFYTLPMSIQTKVKELMKQMITNNVAIFPAGWQEGMKKKLLKLSEK
jgi:hypothetical protein